MNTEYLYTIYEYYVITHRHAHTHKNHLIYFPAVYISSMRVLEKWRNLAFMPLLLQVVILKCGMLSALMAWWHQFQGNLLSYLTKSEMNRFSLSVLQKKSTDRRCKFFTLRLCLCLLVSQSATQTPHIHHWPLLVWFVMPHNPCVCLGGHLSMLNMSRATGYHGFPVFSGDL